MAQLRFRMAQLRFRMTQLRFRMAQLRFRMAQLRFRMAQLRFRMAQLRFRMAYYYWNSFCQYKVSHAWPCTYYSKSDTYEDENTSPDVSDENQCHHKHTNSCQGQVTIQLHTQYL